MNKTYSTTEIIEWIADQKKKCGMRVDDLPINEMRNWGVDTNGKIRHKTGGFFEVRGYRISGANREVASWDQPLVYQERMGILGILSAKIGGISHFLLQAKVEPGNVGLVQLSPTLQATFSNLDQVHAGKKPVFADYFYQAHPDAIVRYKQWLAEDGGRFYQKSNLNMLIELELSRVPSFSDDFRWINLKQVKELLHQDNLVGPHVRSILVHL